MQIFPVDSWDLEEYNYAIKNKIGIFYTIAWFILNLTPEKDKIFRKNYLEHLKWKVTKIVT